MPEKSGVNSSVKIHVFPKLQVSTDSHGTSIYPTRTTYLGGETIDVSLEGSKL